MWSSPSSSSTRARSTSENATESARSWSSTGKIDPVPLEERIRALEDASAIAERLDIPELLNFVCFELDQLYWDAGSPALSLGAARRRLDVLDRIDSRFDRAEILATVAFTIMLIEGNYREVEDLARRSYALAKDMSPHALMHATCGLIGAAYHAGRWAELLPILDEHVAAYQHEAEVSCGMVRGGPLLGAMALAHRGDVDRARELAAMVPFRPDSDIYAIHARVAVACDDAESGRRMAEDVLGSQPASTKPQAIIAMIESLIATQRWEDLREFLRPLDDAAGDVPIIRPTLDRAHGLLRLADGDVNEGAQALRKALEGFERLRVPFEAARTREALAGCVEPAESSVLLRDALSTYERLAARPHAERVRSALG